MYSNQYTPQYFQYIQPYQQSPANNYQMYNYNQQLAYSTPQPTQTAATFIGQTIPVQQPQATNPRKKLSTVWMGNVEPYMTESFITSAFHKMGEFPKNIKLIRNKDTGQNAGYAYVDLYDPVSVMRKLNGKFIHGTNPPVKFKINHTLNDGKSTSNGRGFSVWLGDLSPGVDDNQLYETFSSRYPSIRKAKVVLDSYGFSRGYGFMNFAIEEERKHFLNNMNGFPGLGSKPIKVAIPKSKRLVASNDSQEYNASQDYGQYFETDCWRLASGIWFNLERNLEAIYEL